MIHFSFILVTCIFRPNQLIGRPLALSTPHAEAWLLFKQNANTQLRMLSPTYGQTDTPKQMQTKKSGKLTVTWRHTHRHKPCNYDLAGTTDLPQQDLCQRCGNVDGFQKARAEEKAGSQEEFHVALRKWIHPLYFSPSLPSSRSPICLSVTSAQQPPTQWSENNLLGSELPLNTVGFLTASHTWMGTVNTSTTSS